MGFLNGCQIAAEMIRAGKCRTAMVVTSEVELNREMHPDKMLGLVETGSAVLLDTTAENRTGFSNFSFHYDCEKMDLRRATGGYLDGKPCLDLQIDQHLFDAYLKMIPVAVDKVLADEGLDISDIDFFLPPQISPDMNSKLPNLLGVEPHRFVDVAREDADLFTSALPYSLEYLQREKSTQPGKIGLVIHVASGLQVGCAVYYF